MTWMTDDFISEFKDTPYPFTDTSVFRTRDKRDIPFSLFTDANVYTYKLDGLLCLTQIVVGVSTITFSFSSNKYSNSIVGVYDLNGNNSYVVLNKAEDPSVCCGVMLCDRDGIAVVSSWPINTYVVPFGYMRLLPRCCRVMIANGVTGISVKGTKYTQHPAIIFSDGLVAEPSSIFGANADNTNVVAIHAVGEPLSVNSSDTGLTIRGVLAIYNNLLQKVIVETARDETESAFKRYTLAGNYVRLNGISTEDNPAALNISGSGNTLTIGLSGVDSGI